MYQEKGKIQSKKRPGKARIFMFLLHALMMVLSTPVFLAFQRDFLFDKEGKADRVTNKVPNKQLSDHSLRLNLEPRG